MFPLSLSLSLSRRTTPPSYSVVLLKKCDLGTSILSAFVLAPSPPFSPDTPYAQVPFQLSLGALTTITAGLGMLPRALKGSKYTPVSSSCCYITRATSDFTMWFAYKFQQVCWVVILKIFVTFGCSLLATCPGVFCC